MTERVPDFATHYYMPGRRAFDNLSDLSDDDAYTVMEGLTAERLTGTHQRLFGIPYLLMRRETERRLREAFIEAGGKPLRAAPHYLVLGESPWFRGLAGDMREVHVPLDVLNVESTSVTWGDSFEVMRVAAESGFGGETEKPYHGQTFRVGQIEELAARYGLPDMSEDLDYAGYEHRPGEKFIEIQVWDDDILKRVD